MTDAELDTLMGRVAAAKKCHDDWVREDGITVVNEGLMPLLVAAITTLRAQLAEARAMLDDTTTLRRKNANAMTRNSIGDR